MSYEIKRDKISDWIRDWEDGFGLIAADPKAIKTLVYLALLERQNEWSSYEDIAKELKAREVIEKDIDDRTLALALRNGMHQIGQALKQDKIYELEKDKEGRQALYKIIKRNQFGMQLNTSSDEEIVLILNPSLPTGIDYTSMEYIAERLIKDHRMPFYGIYLPMRAASRWVLYSEKEAEKREYEGKQFKMLLGEWLAQYRGQEISLFGLGVGEGIGEIEFINELLSEKYGFKRIHYCAIDTNIHLLLDHIERLRDRFKGEIRNKRLVCGAIRGNFLTDFSHLVQTLRDEFRKKRQFSDLETGFLPAGAEGQSSGTIVSILGNLLGNLERRASEWSYFQPILESLKGHDLVFLVGVSVQQAEPETYERDLDDLLLATPKYLTYELGILKSHPPAHEKLREFILPEDDEKEKMERCPPVEAATYVGEGLIRETHIKGHIYEFHYKTKWELTMELKEETLSIPGGTALLLYNIIKFDLATLIAFLKSRGLELLAEPGEPYKVGEREYAMFAVRPKLQS